MVVDGRLEVAAAETVAPLELFRDIECMRENETHYDTQESISILT